MTPLLFLKATLLLLVALGVAQVYRRTPRRAHQTWTIAFASLLALPGLGIMLPPVSVPVSSLWWAAAAPQSQPSFPDATMPPAVAADGKTIAGDDPSAVVSAARAPRTWTLAWPGVGAAFLFLWGAGAAAAIATILLSLFRVRRLAQSAAEVRDPAWRAAADAAARRLGVRGDVRLLMSGAIDTPMAGEFPAPTVFLPCAARDWNGEYRDTVLAHELAHLAGHDPRRHLVARLMVAMYWFHPLAWVAARSGAIACEDACDEAVLQLGVRPSSYARILLELAGSAGPRHAAPALPIVSRSPIERRLVKILENSVTPRSASQFPLPAFACALLAIAIASAHPRLDASSPDSPDIDLIAVERGTAAPPVEAPPTRNVNAPPAAGRRVRPEAAPPTSLPSACEIGQAALNTGSRGLRRQPRYLRERFDDLQVCLRIDEGNVFETERPTELMRRAHYSLIEARRDGHVQQLEITRDDDGNVREEWRVNGTARPLDAAAASWRDSIVDVLETSWDIWALQGQEGLLQGRIGEIHGQLALGEMRRSDGERRVQSLREQIAALNVDERIANWNDRREGEVSRFRVAMAAVR